MSLIFVSPQILMVLVLLASQSSTKSRQMEPVDPNHVPVVKSSTTRLEHVKFLQAIVQLVSSMLVVTATIFLPTVFLSTSIFIVQVVLPTSPSNKDPVSLVKVPIPTSLAQLVPISLLLTSSTIKAFVLESLLIVLSSIQPMVSALPARTMFLQSMESAVQTVKLLKVQDV